MCKDKFKLLQFRLEFEILIVLRQSPRTVDYKGNAQQFSLPEGSRHDPCVAVRGVPVVKAMAAIVIVDALLLNRCAKISLSWGILGDTYRC